MEMEFQDARRVLKAVYGHSNSESSDNKRCKTLHIMFKGSWDIMSRRIIKTLRLEIMVAAPALKAAPHHKWVETPIGFDASDYPKSMAGAGQLPLLVSPPIANVKLYHILIDGGQPPVQRHFGRTGFVPVYGGGPLQVPGPKDVIPQWCPQDPRRP
jgi:hypothetical protein